jgi:DNA repair exonuclease SbcCD ATPase subunit
MKILRMTLENFAGVRKAEFIIGGRNANFYGENATGKTTVYNAFTWLLFGKTSDDTVKTIVGDDFAHNLEHIVECELDIDGEVVTLKRVFHEVYKKTRGNPEASMSGHTTNYFINGSPKKEKEYQRYLEDVFKGAEAPEMLTSLDYFASDDKTHWEKRRRILLDIFGDIDDNAIAESDTELKALPALLGSLTVDEFKKSVKTSMTDINRKIQSIPPRIDEANRAIANFAEVNPLEIPGLIVDTEHQIEIERKSRSELEAERAAIISGATGTSEIRREIAETEVKLSQAKAAYAERCQQANHVVQEKLHSLQNSLMEAKSKIDKVNFNLTAERRRLGQLEEIRADVIKKHREISAEQFDENSTICPCCKRSYPSDEIDNMRESFNLDRSKRLEAVLERGKREASKDMVQALNEKISVLEQELEYAQEDVVAAQETLCTEAIQAFPVFETTAVYNSLIQEINSLKKALTDVTGQSLNLTYEVDEKLKMLSESERANNNCLAGLKTAQTQYARIAELEAEEKNFGKAYEKAQHALYLCEKFSRVKSSLLNDRINEKFSTLKFRLFEENISNDGIKDCCDVLVPSPTGALVPFGKANNAARINAGIEIIGVLGEHYGVELPLFVDNAESITRIIPTTAQLIRLIVSKDDMPLRLELA